MKTITEKNATACVISSYAYINEHINYGALLQYYALENAFRKYGISTYWLRYRLASEKKLKHIAKRFIKILINPRQEKNIRNTLTEFKEFLNTYCHVSDKDYFTEEELEESCPEADIFITGSDQVWGGILKPNYLCFVPETKYKVSYAASFGKSYISSEQRKITQDWIRRIDKVSVREKSGLAICEEMGVKAEWLLDPTLLLNSDEYPVHRLDDKVNIFCYFLNISSNDEVFWTQIVDYSTREMLSLKVSSNEITIRQFPGKYVELLGPCEWLGRYSDADYILTNTFHGTVFAIIFHKQFLVIKQRGESEKQNERLVSLLCMLGLENRFYDPTQPIDEQLHEDIDWQEVDSCINERREHSEHFIQDIQKNYTKEAK